MILAGSSKRCSLRSLAAIMPVAWLLSAGNGLAFSSDASSLVRTSDRWTARTNSPVVFTLTFSNGCANPLRGFYFTDQLPADLTVTPLAVTLNGVPVTNYSFISGQPGDVYSGCTPSRWVLERPTALLEMNPTHPGSLIRIQYSITSPTPGSFALQEYSWVGYDETSTNASFGYSEPTNQQTLTFISEPPVVLLSLKPGTNALTLQLMSTEGASFIVQQSTNLSQWSPVATNTAPFSLTFTNSVSPIPGFYRALWLP
jgi:uncharacterized repeat protein (TIGR01451 family)